MLVDVAGWFLEDTSKLVWGSLPGLHWYRLAHILAATLGKEDLGTSHPLLCVLAASWRRWFGLFHNWVPEQATSYAEAPELKHSRNEADGAVTPALDYPSCLGLAPVTTLQPLAEGLGSLVFTGKNEMWLYGNITDARERMDGCTKNTVVTT